MGSRRNRQVESWRNWLATEFSQKGVLGSHSRTMAAVAKAKLLCYGLTEDELHAAGTDDAVQRARMILRGKAKGWLSSATQLRVTPAIWLTS